MDHPTVTTVTNKEQHESIPPPSYEEAVGTVNVDQIQLNPNDSLNQVFENQDVAKKNVVPPPMTTQPRAQLPAQTYNFPPPNQQNQQTTQNDLLCLWCISDGTDIADCCYCLFCCSRHVSNHDSGCCDCGDDCCSCPDDCCNCNDDCNCGDCNCDCGDCNCDCGDCNCDCGDCTIL